MDDISRVGITPRREDSPPRLFPSWCRIDSRSFGLNDMPRERGCVGLLEGRRITEGVLMGTPRISFRFSLSFTRSLFFATITSNMSPISKTLWLIILLTAAARRGDRHGRQKGSRGRKSEEKEREGERERQRRGRGQGCVRSCVEIRESPQNPAHGSPLTTAHTQPSPGRCTTTTCPADTTRPTPFPYPLVPPLCCTHRCL